ncbi:MAG: hypothetical protein HYX34_13085 [Actinobacteria bacterium]|nr:hypothetical protein [Actinomycetota bacterium]
MEEFEDIDRRSSLFVGLTSEALAQHVASYTRTDATPRSVSTLLAEARRTFVGAAACYDNFASSAFKSLQAAELALRERVGGTERRLTLGALLQQPTTAEALTPDQFAWFQEFALPFRNRLAHPDESIAFTPGMAEPFVRTAHEIVAAMFPDA